MPPAVIYDPAGAWIRVGRYASSSETECPGQHEDEGSIVRADHCVGGDRCPLCEEKIGEEHGYIYMGDGCSETLYRREDPAEVDE
jgi:hypothetical protein